MIELNILDRERAASLIDPRPVVIRRPRHRGQDSSCHYLVVYEIAAEPQAYFGPQEYLPSADHLWARLCEEHKEDGIKADLLALGRIENSEIVVKSAETAAVSFSEAPVRTEQLIARIFGTRQAEAASCVRFADHRVKIDGLDYGSLRQLVRSWGLGLLY